MSRKKIPPSPLEINYNDYDLKVCSFTKALGLANELMCKGENFRIRFVKKQDESSHILLHVCEPLEVKIDEDGKKWKRFYE